MLVGRGDLAAARLFYERAVDAGDAKAAIYLGTTYDPSFLSRARLGKTVRADLGTAAYWYRRARDLGSSDAEALLKAVHNNGSPGYQ
jgi:TPR repeat protein